MIEGYPKVHRWEQTDDVIQNAVIRLQRTLQQLTVAAARDFFRLVTLQIRRELLDLASITTGRRTPARITPRTRAGSFGG
jgi:RNA polymerase sigma-70 factor (ECF subfamily)